MKLTSWDVEKYGLFQQEFRLNCEAMRDRLDRAIEHMSRQVELAMFCSTPDDRVREVRASVLGVREQPRFRGLSALTEEDGL